MIYFARCGKWLKIGFSENGVKQRIESFRTGNPEPIEYFGEVEGFLSDEKELHRYFRLERGLGEWFELKGVLRKLFTHLLMKRHYELREPVLREDEQYFRAHPEESVYLHGLIKDGYDLSKYKKRDIV